ncbi:MAG: DUF3108 domain-containing protein [Alphaproteobacteria bacterium]
MKNLFALSAGVMLISSLAYGETTSIKYSGHSGIAPVADVSISMTANNNNYENSLDGKGVGIASVTRMIIKAKSKGTTGGTTAPNWAQVWSSRKGDTRNTIITYKQPTPNITITPNWKPRSKNEILNRNQIINSIDPMATLMKMTNQMRLKDSCWGSFNVSDGRSALNVTLVSGGKEQVSTTAYKGNAHICQVKIKALSGRVLRDAKAGSVETANVYFAKIKGKEYPVPVKITGKFAGFGISLNADSIK